MTFTWPQYIELADALLTDSEASRRTAVSRAYYAVFHAARRRRNRDLGFESTRTIGHQDLWDHFKRTSVTKQLGFRGERLLKRRQKADYDISPAWDLMNARTAVDDARRLLNDIDALERDTPC